MGVTVAYRGRLADLTRIEDFTDVKPGRS